MKVGWASIAEFDAVGGVRPGDYEQPAPFRIEWFLKRTGSSTVRGLEDGLTVRKGHGSIGSPATRLVIGKPRHRGILDCVDPGSLRCSSATADEIDPEIVR